MLAVCSFYGCFIVFVCLSLWCWGLGVDLIVSVPDFSYLFKTTKLWKISLTHINR